ncbi:type I phosphodiesterase/nucleotide pyrophosphatase [Lindgomyces ingoldianus]|uniref:Type I phosphodiesterase/nucleotide pyrophosphatase n=1 Tax=Lindgomyces ingoldianus TaxID=673940 RepID=A0ACB6R7C6_9PLEO|nr:type I phosphodiesterase/nucleotide pyrophosphatase [Lindgomyces ingoldianus]KAF2474960.1 type I phosphodiesterase/nucleotide pyrophosphatase [Lindgomyces ingoldianus]
MKNCNSILLFSLAGQAIGSPLLPRKDGVDVKHVAVFSIDGLHNSDIDKWLALGPSNISKLLGTGYRYTNAWATFPSDSFPGTLAPYTGATPRTTGVWYDDIWDRSFFAPGSGLVYDEGVDVDSTKLFTTIDPAKLPQALIKGQCTNIYPHMRPRVNTAFEVVVGKGLKTAYTDKHPSYDLVRGPSGKGLSTGYFPEIASTAGGVDATTAYDQLHVNAWLNWIEGKDIANAEGSLGGKVPTLFGGNFQAVSVGQKTAGYVKGSLAFTDGLKKAIKFVDDSLGLIIKKLEDKDMLTKTMIVIAPKHGQSPINPDKFGEVDPKLVTAATGVPVVWQTSDSIALIFLKDQKDLAKAVAGLQSQATALKISDIIYGDRLIKEFGDPSKDPAVPDIVVAPIPGIIYSTSKKKISEHGGLSEEDRHVGVLVSHPKLKKAVFEDKVFTTQVAPTILEALDLEAEELVGVKAEGTKALPGFDD